VGGYPSGDTVLSADNGRVRFVNQLLWVTLTPAYRTAKAAAMAIFFGCLGFISLLMLREEFKQR